MAYISKAIKTASVLALGQATYLANDFSVYPGYTGPLQSVSGRVVIDSEGTGIHTTTGDIPGQRLYWEAYNIDPDCDKVCTAANCCGIHIHSGTTCAASGGHLWNTAITSHDTWLPMRYFTSDYAVDSSGTTVTQYRSQGSGFVQTG
eukprot:TRINITY_DN22630_c0_g1_i6.p1 TRINITY_DN22630_c0_g1~~TRINITY_DN22630_c0_g1_i6.p1  ORF type:complete len:147 (-),score=11.15 TRINITY_DN22630_c0_g1_i6:1107-1547(-)